MKIFVIGFLVFLLSAKVAVADPNLAVKPPPTKDQMMKAWMAYSTPGEPHKTLATMAGHWTYTSKYWEAADAQPEESTGTSKMKMILGGRFLQNEVKGKAMGQPFEGLGFTGYDNIKGKYDTIWLDSMGTGVMHGKGNWDTSTNSLKDSGEMSCPMSFSKVAKFRGDWKIIDKNNMIYAMFGSGPQGGAEFKQMEMIFKRTK